MVATKIQTKDLDLKPILSTGSASQYLLSIERLDSYEDRMTIFWTPHVVNESGCVVNINNLGDIQLTDKTGTVLGAGDLQPGIGYFMTYSSSTGKFAVVNLGEGSGSGSTQEINMVFDDENSDLPVDTSQTIDGCTINDGSVIYVKNCSDTNKIGKFYEAQVTGTDIGWIERYDLKVYNPTYVTCGTVYGGKVNYFSDYLFSGNVTFMGDEVNYSSNTTVNYDGNTINYNQVTENYTDSTTNVDGGNVTYNNTEINYDSSFTLLGCTTGITSFPADVTLETDVTKAHLTVNYDNTVNDPIDSWTKELDIVEGVGTVTINESGKTGTLTVTWNTGDTVIHIEKVNGDGDFTVDVCQYSGGVIINDNGSVQNIDNTVVNNTSVNEYYDENSTVVNEGDTYLKNVYVENIYNEDGTAFTIDISSDIITINSDTIYLEEGNVVVLVEKNDSDVTVTLPDANENNGKIVRIKKYTGNDDYNVIVKPQIGQAIDGNTDGVTFNIDKGQYAFIAINNNWFIF